MGIHYDYKSTKGNKLMEKQAKRERKLAEKKAKRLAKEGPKKEEPKAKPLDPNKTIGVPNPPARTQIIVKMINSAPKINRFDWRSSKK